MALEQHIINGFAFTRQGRGVRALEEFDAVLKIDQTSEMAYFGKGEVYRTENKLLEAISMYDKSIEYKRDTNVKALAFKAVILNGSGRVAEAQSIFQQLQTIIAKDAYDYTGLGLMYMVFGQIQKSLDAYNQATKVDTSFALGYLLKGNLYDVCGNKSEALNCYSKAIECDAMFAIAHHNRGNSFFSIRNLEGAIREYDKALKINGELAITHHQKANVLFTCGKISEAKQEYNIAIKYNPDLVLAHVDRGNVFLREGNVREALRSYDKAISIAPSFFPAYVQKSNVYLQQNKFDEAIHCCDEALKVEAIFVPAIIHKMNILKSLNRHDEAVACNHLLSQKVTAQIGHILYNNAGNDLADIGKFEDAIIWYDRAMSIAHKFAPAYVNKGLALASLGSHEEAIVQYREAMIIEKSFWQALNNEGLSLASLGRYDEAIERYLEAIKLQPDLVILWNNLGSVYLSSGQKEKAIESYDKALKINPDFIDAHINRWIVFLSLEEDKKLIESKSKPPALFTNESDYLVKGNTSAKDVLPNYETSQIQQFLSDFVTVTDSVSSGTELPKELLPKDLLSSFLQKISKSSDQLEEVTKVVHLLRGGQKWPEEVINPVAESLCEVVKTSPDKIDDVIKLVVTRMQSEKEQAYDSMSHILCVMVRNIQNSVTLIKNAITPLLTTDKEEVFIAAAKVWKEIIKISGGIQRDASTQTYEDADQDLQYQFDASIFMNDLLQFKRSMSDVSQEEKYISEYTTQYQDKGIKSAEIVYSLILSAAIVLKDMEVITHILSKNFGHNHLLAYVDKYGNSPIANVLLSKDEKMLEMSRDYIARNATGHGSDVSLKQELKPPCVGDNLTNILNAVHWPQFVDLARKDMLEHYLYPVYEETSLEQVRELIGSLED